LTGMQGPTALVPRPTLAMPLLPMTCITANNNESAAKKRILGMALLGLGRSRHFFPRYARGRFREGDGIRRHASTLGDGTARAV
jgi:hypothetical protein